MKSISLKVQLEGMANGCILIEFMKVIRVLLILVFWYFGVLRTVQIS